MSPIDQSMNLGKFALHKPKPEAPLTFATAKFGNGEVLAFDQTLTKTGWALVKSGTGKITVPECGVLRPPKAETQGFEDNYARALWLYDEMLNLIVRYNPFIIVQEMPAVGGYRTDSSLMAGLSLRIAAQGCGKTVFMISQQTAKKLATGNAKAEKRDVKKAVEARVDLLDKKISQDISDAIALALVHLNRMTVRL